MRLLRVQVPDFQKDFFAQIFPIGSLVGWVEARNPTPVA